MEFEFKGHTYESAPEFDTCSGCALEDEDCSGTPVCTGVIFIQKVAVKDFNLKPHKHAEVIRMYADGHPIQFRECSSDDWSDIGQPSFNESMEYRVRPSPDYPASRLSPHVMEGVYGESCGHGHGLMAVANAAIKEFIIRNNIPLESLK